MEVVFVCLSLAAVIGLLWWAAKRSKENVRTSRSVPLRYTKHAQERMALRRVERAQIESVIANPARVEKDEKEGSVRLEGDFGTRVLKVWVAEPWPAIEEIVVKSTAWKFFFDFTVPPGAVGRILGVNGQNIKNLEMYTGTKVSVRRDGAVRVSSGSVKEGESVKAKILSTATHPVVRPGERWIGTVQKHLLHGVLVTSPQGVTGLLPVAKMRPLVGGKHIEDLTTVVSIGQTLNVQVDEMREGKIRLTLAS